MSGASERKLYDPEVVVVSVSVCPGDATVTDAPAIGWPVSLSVTRPCKPPVVPENAGIVETMTRALTNTENAIFRSDTSSSPKADSEGLVKPLVPSLLLTCG